MTYDIGIDLGSTSAKIIVLNDQGEIIHREVRPTGWSSVETARSILSDLDDLGFTDRIVTATGYGRVAVPMADQTVTEISCHARGAGELFDADNLLIIDIGGQDTKIIRLEGGSVTDFLMNDKCAAGTGRFLEEMANTMGVDIPALCEMAALGTGKATISSLCTVFAQSEVTGMIGSGLAREEIAWAVVDSIARKVATQLSRSRVSAPRTVLTGGLCDCDEMIDFLSTQLGTTVESQKDARYAGALGAALKSRQLRLKRQKD